MYVHPNGMGMFIHVKICYEKLIFIEKFDRDCSAILSPLPHMAEMTKIVITLVFVCLFFLRKYLVTSYHDGLDDYINLS